MAIDETVHREFLESAALYAVDALPEDERRAFEAHARTCADCARELRSFGATVAGLSLAVAQVDPPPPLRERVLGSHRSARPGSNAAAVVPRPAARWDGGWYSRAALLVAAIGLTLYAATLRRQIAGLEGELRDTALRLDRSERQLEAATRAVDGAQLRMAVLLAPDLARVDLAGQAPAPKAAARAFWSRSRGLVFTASALPALPPGRTYQLWVVTATRAISAGLIQPDAGGGLTVFFSTPADIPPPVAMAVTLEPEGGLPAPTGDKYLVGQAH